MKEYHTSIEIEAPGEEVWNVLTDYDSYPKWNPLVSKLTGDTKEGGQIRAAIVPLGTTFSGQLISFKKNDEMVWRWKWVAGFLLAGTHYYRLEERKGHLTNLKHGEYFAGFLSWFLPRKLLQRMETAFVLHNKALKKRVEDER